MMLHAIPARNLLETLHPLARSSLAGCNEHRFPQAQVGLSGFPAKEPKAGTKDGSEPKAFSSNVVVNRLHYFFVHSGARLHISLFCSRLCQPRIHHYLFSFFFLIATLFYYCATEAVASPGCVSFEEGQSNYNLNDAVSYYEDQSESLSLEQILAKQDDIWTGLSSGEVPSFGFSNSAYWLKFSLCTPQAEGKKPVLEINYPLLDSINLYAVAGPQVIYDVHSGDSIPFSQRPVQHRNFLFLLPDFQQEAVTFYIRVHTKSAVQVPLQLYTSSGFFIHNQRALLVQGGYFGIILAMILYNAFLFFSLRELPYLLYVLFACSFFSFQGVFQGFCQQFIFDSPWWQNHSLLLFGFISILFANLFADSFLNLRRNNPFVSRVLCGIALLSALSALLVFAGPSYALMVKLMLTLSMISSVSIMVAGFKLWWGGHLPARIFTLAWSTMLVAFILASLNKFALLPRVFWTEHIMQIGGVLEVVLLSIALAERINEEKRQRILAEQILSSSLEEKVQARTLELNQALERLETANAILDKMSLTDSLTEIANRRSFDNQIEIEFKSSKRGGYPLSLIMIDIDHFKKINDNHGHQVGDQVLRMVAKTLCSFATRPRDKVFRYGGEEFAIVLNKTPIRGAITLAEKMRKIFEASPLNVHDAVCSVTISVGISVYDPANEIFSATDLDDLIYRADSLLYQAKTNGRNRIAALGMAHEEA